MGKEYGSDVIVAFAEKTIRKLWVLVILLTLLLFGSNAAWIWYESQWEVVETETYTSESGDNGIAIVNRDGEVSYGEGKLHEN